MQNLSRNILPLKRRLRRPTGLIKRHFSLLFLIPPPYQWVSTVYCTQLVWLNIFPIIWPLNKGQLLGSGQRLGFSSSNLWGHLLVLVTNYSHTEQSRNCLPVCPSVCRSISCARFRATATLEKTTASQLTPHRANICGISFKFGFITVLSCNHSVCWNRLNAK